MLQYLFKLTTVIYKSLIERTVDTGYWQLSCIRNLIRWSISTSLLCQYCLYISAADKFLYISVLVY